MIEKMWEILTTLTEASQQAALSKCEELGFDKNRGVVSLDESFINLTSACNILKDAIEKEKLIQLPITVQKIFTSTLEAIAKHQAGLITGSDEVVNLSDAIEKLNTNIWLYGLHNLSDEVLGYQTKLNQLKNMEVEANRIKRELQKGISVKDKLEQILNSADQQTDLLQKYVTDAEVSEAKASEALALTLDASKNASAFLTTTQQNETTSTQILIATSKSNAEILALEENIHGLVAGFTNLKDELESNRNEQKLLFDQFESYREAIDGLLIDANKTGMAASFAKRKKELFDPMQYWLLLFACSILGLVVLGVIYLAPVLEASKLEQLPFRLALTAPFIWLGWFSAKQYGYTARLREDYAYKEASAMSFEGYKREAKDASPEVQKNLLDTAIKNLGENPIRIYSGLGNHASPLQELWDSSLKDVKLADIVKAISTRDKP